MEQRAAADALPSADQAEGCSTETSNKRWGKDDAIRDASRASEFARRGRASARVFEGAGHTAMREDPQGFAEAWLLFLEALPPPASPVETAFPCDIEGHTLYPVADLPFSPFPSLEYYTERSGDDADMAVGFATLSPRLGTRPLPSPAGATLTLTVLPDSVGWRCLDARIRGRDDPVVTLLSGPVGVTLTVRTGGEERTASARAEDGPSDSAVILAGDEILLRVPDEHGRQALARLLDASATTPRAGNHFRWTLAGEWSP